MSLAAQLTDLVARCASSEAGRAALSTYDHVVQFTVLDGEPFYLTVRAGAARVADGVAPALPVIDTHEIKAPRETFGAWFAGRLRMIDAIETGRMFPSASHTTKRHIDHWLATIIRVGNGRESVKEVY
jgi:hypothetical protein